jgi:hypothetical protein
MFDFEKLDVYNEIRDVNRKVLAFLNENKEIPDFIRKNFKNTTMEIQLDLADGTSRMTRNEKRDKYTQSRANVFICVAILQTLIDMNGIDKVNYEDFYGGYERISKMLLGMIRSADSRNGN